MQYGSEPLDSSGGNYYITSMDMLDKIAVLLKYPIRLDKPPACIYWQATINGQANAVGEPFCIGESKYERIAVDQAYDWLYETLEKKCVTMNL